LLDYAGRKAETFEASGIAACVCILDLKENIPRSLDDFGRGPGVGKVQA
jgi:hypothetical protein